jgi:hypothetical protein
MFLHQQVLEMDLGPFAAVHPQKLAEKRRVEAETNPGYARRANESLGPVFSGPTGENPMDHAFSATPGCANVLRSVRIQAHALRHSWLSAAPAARAIRRPARVFCRAGTDTSIDPVQAHAFPIVIARHKRAS